MAGFFTSRTATHQGALALALGIGTTSFLLAGAALALTRGSGSVSAIWPVNAVVLIVLLRTPRSAWWPAILALTLGSMAARLVNGDDVPQAAFLSLANGVEPLIAARFLNLGFQRRLSRWDGALRFIGVCLLACVASMTLAFAALSLLENLQPFKTSGLWLTAHWLGLTIFAPVISIIADAGVFGLVDRKKLGKTCLIFAGLIAVTLATFWQTQYPLLFLAPIMMALVAFQLGLGGAALACMIVASVAVPLTFAGRGPIALIDADTTFRVLVLQAFLGSTTLMALFFGAAVLDRRESERIAVVADEQNRLLKLAEDMAGVGTWSWDVASNRTTWSDQTYRIHGYDPGIEPPALQGVLERYHPDDAKILADHVQLAVTEGRDYAFDARIYRPDGSERHVVARGACRRGPDGTVEALSGTFQDVTDHVTAERFIRTLTDNLPGLVGYWDAEMRCRFANAAYGEWFGQSPQSMRSMILPDLLGPELYAKNELFIHAALNGDRQSFPRTLIKPGGEVGHIWTQYIPDIDATGRTCGMYVLASDVTALKKAEEALQETNLLLAAARDQAEAAVAVKSEFLSNMSHEIRTPLSGVLGFAEVLSDTVLDDEQRRYVDRIRTAGKGLAALIDDILEFSRIEAGKLSIHHHAFDLRGMAEEVLALVERGMVSKPIRFIVEVAEDIPATIRGDDARIRQILLNIVGNAAKFTEAGSIRVEARQRDNMLELRVRDTGSGIEAEHLAGLFEGFTQLDGSITRRFGGSGLGLSISRSLALLMEGDLVVESQIGVGTTAILTVPYHPAVEQPPSAPNKATAATVPASASLHVMLVDDGEMNRELMDIMLRNAGHSCRAFGDALSAIAALDAGLVCDLILMDVQMPDMDGLAATRLIRQLHRSAATLPIVALTANVLPEQVAACRDAGMDDHLAKPVDLKALTAVLDRLAVRQGRSTKHDDGRKTRGASAMDELTLRYVQHLSELPAEIDRLLVEGRSQELARAVHSVAGTGGSFGFPRLSEAAFALEAAAKRGTRTKRLRAELETTIVVFKDAISDAITSPAGSSKISPVRVE